MHTVYSTLCCVVGNRWEDSRQWTRNENGSSVNNAHTLIFISMNTLCVPCLLGNAHQTLLSSSAFGVRRSPKCPTGLKDASWSSYVDSVTVCSVCSFSVFVDSVFIHNLRVPLIQGKWRRPKLFDFKKVAFQKWNLVCPVLCFPGISLGKSPPINWKWNVR